MRPMSRSRENRCVAAAGRPFYSSERSLAMLIFCIVVLVILLVTVAPVMIAARIVGARRTGFWASLLALIVSYLIIGVAAHIFRNLGLLAFFVAPLGFMLILDTTYLRGLLMVILQYVIIGVIFVVLMFTALGSVVHFKDIMRHVPIDTGPVQSV